METIMNEAIALLYQYPLQIILGAWLVLALLSLRASVNSETQRRRYTYKNRTRNRKHSSTRRKW